MNMDLLKINNENNCLVAELPLSKVPILAIIRF